MSYRAKKAWLRSLLHEAVRKTDGTRQHRTVSGDMVSWGCPDCVDDLDNRIDDAAYARDGCSPRTDARGYYNGLLNVLRRERRSAGKEFIKLYAEPE